MSLLNMFSLVCVHTHTVRKIRDVSVSRLSFYQLKVWAFTGFLKHVLQQVGLLLPSA